MGYLVFCTFDLSNAARGEYDNAYADLAKLGLSRVPKGTNRDVVIPTTSVMGEYNGTSAASVRDHVRQKVAEAFKARGFQSEIFIVVGGDRTWGSTTT